MKRNGDIRSFFYKAAKKPAAAALNPTPPPVETVVEEHNREDRAEVEEIADPSPPPASSPPPPPASKPPVYDINLLPYDPGERLPIKDYHVNDQYAIRKAYITQEMGLPRPGDTRWGSYYKTICSIITMYSSIHDVLIELGADIAYKDDWTKIHFVLGAFETFEFVFFVHLMYVILGYTNELSECLQRRDQDILNAISLVNVAKSRMQQLRSDGWDKFHKTVTSFCITHGVEVPAMDDAYVPYGKSARYARARNQKNDDHFRREVCIGVIDQISQELDNRFDEINMELLSCMSAFSPSKSFASFDAQKLRRLAEFYHNDFSNNNLVQLELQLDNCIDDMKRTECFQGLDNIVDLSVKLVDTNRHKVYDMVYSLLKLVLLLPVATASVERVFSALVIVKTKSRNKLGDIVLDDCLQTFIERDIFFQVDEDDIIETFMSLRKRRFNK
ncbi:uncharacterized protein [Miscanthus floridulus]|uniref:uncharacterized protein n=1 Tax=Miscanthus floridulus TaxID=154761 RepID=UPI00345759CE